VNAVLRREGAEVLNLGPSDGYPPLKQALLEMLHHDGISPRMKTCSLPMDASSPSTNQQSVCAAGDSVIMENPTYPGAVAIFHGARARCLSVPMNTHAEPGKPLGWIWKRSRRHWRRTASNSFCLRRTFRTHGNFDAAGIAAQIAGIGGRHQVPVVEDHIYARLHAREERIPSLKQLDRSNWSSISTALRKWRFLACESDGLWLRRRRSNGSAW